MHSHDSSVPMFDALESRLLMSAISGDCDRDVQAPLLLVSPPGVHVSPHSASGYTPVDFRVLCSGSKIVGRLMAGSTQVARSFEETQSWGMDISEDSVDFSTTMLVLIKSPAWRSEWQGLRVDAAYVTDEGLQLYYGGSIGGQGTRGRQLYAVVALAKSDLPVSSHMTSGMPVLNAVPLEMRGIEARAGRDRRVRAQQHTDDHSIIDATVQLNGSRSSARSAPIVSYVWSEGGHEIASGVSPEVSLTPGRHRIVLTTIDATGRVSTDSLVVRVLGPKYVMLTPSPFSHLASGVVGQDISWVDGGPPIVPQMMTEGLYVIKSVAELEAAGRSIGMTLPSVDFTKQMVIIVAKEFGDTSWQMEVDNVTTSETAITVKCTSRRVSEIGFCVMNTQFCAISVPRSDLPVEVVHTIMPVLPGL